MKTNDFMSLAAGIIVLLATTNAHADEASLTYDASTKAFSGDVKHVRADSTIRVKIIDTDALRHWSLKTDYEKPVPDQLKASIGFAKDILTLMGGLAVGTEAEHSVSNPVGAREWAKQLSAASAELVSLSRTLVTRSSPATQTAILQSIRTRKNALAADISELEIALAKNDALYSGPPVTYKTPSNGAPDAPAVDAGKSLEAARVSAENALALSDQLLDRIASNVASREASVTVKKGFETLKVQLCSQRLTMDGDSVEAGTLECGESSYTIEISNPLGPFWIAAGLVLPIYTSKPIRYALQQNQLVGKERADAFGGVEPAVLVGLRYSIDDDTGFGIGLEGGVGLRDIGSFYTVGAQVGVYGVSVGGGVFVDTKGDRTPILGADSGSVEERTDSKTLIGPYVRLALSADLWSLVATHAKDLGAKNDKGAASPTDAEGSAEPPKTGGKK